MKANIKYISISNILHLLSAPDSVPNAEPVLACLVVESKIFCNFSVSSSFKFDCYCKIKDWMLPHVMTDFTDHKKLKHLVVVVVVLPTGVVHCTTTNTDIQVGSMQDEVQIKIIWPNNMMDVTKLLSQFPCTWHVDDLNMQQHLVMKKAFNQL